MGESNDWQVPGSGYEIYENVFGPAMMGQWAPKAIALGNPKQGDRVLDVACGTGVLTCLLAKSVGPDGKVAGLDYDPDVLALAREIAPILSNATPIDWREGDASAIPFEAESFDIVFCEFGLMFFPDKVAALKEMRRVLSPSGCLTILVWGSINKCPGQLAMRESWERHFGMDGARMFYRQHSLSDPETVNSLINEAGFRDVSVQTSMGVVRLASSEQLVRSYGAMAEIQADAKTRAEVFDEVSASLQSYMSAEGLVYPIEAIIASAKK